MMLLVLIASENRAYGQEESDSVTVYSIAEIKALAVGTPFTWKATNVCIEFYANGYFCFRDDTDAIACYSPKMTGNAYIGVNDKYYHPTITGCLKKKEDMRFIGESTFYTEREYGDEWYDPEANVKVISQDEYWDHLGEYVAVISDSIFVLDYSRSHSYFKNPDVGEMVKERTLISGGAFPIDGKMSILLPVTGKIYRKLHDDRHNDYSDIGKLNGLYNGGFIERHFDAGKWYTLTFPNSFSSHNSYDGINATIGKFVSAENGILEFKTVDRTGYSEPHLVKFDEDTEYIAGSCWIETETPKSMEGNDYNFVGTLFPMTPLEGSLYLTEGNILRTITAGGIIKGFRAYFEPATPSAARARAISIDGMTTAIEDIEWGDGNPFIAPTDNRIYNLEGQMVGTNLEQLPKGMYIINGKKVIK